MSNTVEQLKAQFEAFLAEDAKFTAGNGAAGTRARKALVMAHELEAQYEQEDEDMMIRLIKIRNSLWT